jgi:hypothetical protein
MIHSDLEYARVEHLITLMRAALTRIATNEPPVDAVVHARLTASYIAQIPALQEELRAYTQLMASLQGAPTTSGSPLQVALRNIAQAERSLIELQARVERLWASPTNHAALTAARAGLSAHAELLGEWQAMLEELVGDHAAGGEAPA